jgi:hypothetical protein
MRKSVFIFLAALASCDKRSLDSASMFSKNGELKEKIALVQMIDSSSHSQNWDISSELCSYLSQDLARKDTLYVIPTGDQVQLSSSKNPFSKNISWIEQDFHHINYIAFTELLKYDEATEEDPQIAHNLDISVRVRVFKKTDSGYTPILQEIVQQSYSLPSLLTNSLSLQPDFNDAGYELSPLGIAHKNFSGLISKRIRDYINP